MQNHTHHNQIHPYYKLGNKEYFFFNNSLIFLHNLCHILDIFHFYGSINSGLNYYPHLHINYLKEFYCLHKLDTLNYPHYLISSLNNSLLLVGIGRNFLKEQNSQIHKTNNEVHIWNTLYSHLQISIQHIKVQSSNNLSYIQYRELYSNFPHYFLHT